METLKDMIEQQCDDMATGTQMREFLLDDDGNEPFMREMLRLNLEQFAKRLNGFMDGSVRMKDANTGEIVTCRMEKVELIKEMK